jgi:3-oxoadipate enol-lactonase
MLKTIVNGIKLAYERRGQGKPLLLVHGYPLDHSIWNQIVPLLETDFDMILPDLRGFGHSDSSQKRFSMTDIAADLAALMDHLEIEKAAIVGHSMGGYVALAFARAHPGRLLGLGLVSSQPYADSPEKKAGRKQEADLVIANGVREVAEGMSTKLTAVPDLQIELKKLMLRQHPEGVSGALRAMAERADSTDILAIFDFPVVIVHGRADKIIPIERAREVLALVKNGKLKEIEGAGHMPMMEAPEVTAEVLRTLR